jgi:serine phosphatase RsbU (regulator of sigma subunit)
MAGGVSIRWSLLGNLLVLIVVLSAAILALTSVGAAAAVRNLSGSLIIRSIDTVHARLGGFFAPVLTDLALVRRWGESGLLDTDRPDDLDALLAPVVASSDQISSILIADDRGHEHMLLHREAGWLSRRTRAVEGGLHSELWTWSDAAPAPVLTSTRTDYDPRGRPWYIGAAARLGGETHWTPPYEFFTSKEPGLTTSTSFVDAAGREQVVGVDLLLRDVSRFTATLDVSENALVFVFSEDLECIGLPGTGVWTDPARRKADLLRRSDDLEAPVVIDAHRTLDLTTTGIEPERFESDGVTWWGGVAPFPLGPEHRLWIAVLVPESDLLGTVHRLRQSILAFTAIVLLVSLVRVARLARRFSAPIESLVRETDRISRGELDAGDPIRSRVKEVQRLAAAQDRMREGLRALLKLERDLLLARQIQQSTFPDRLPTLAGFDLAAWSEPADETGGDTYDVIGCAPAGSGAAITDGAADKAVMLLADATGHGIGPALSVTQIRAMLRMAVRMGEDLPAIARHLNEQLCADLPTARFITAWLGVLDAPSGRLATFSAGQGPLLHYEAAAGRVHARKADTPPFGVVPDLDIVLPDPITLAPGDVYAVISDGIYEAADPDSRLFGIERTGNLLARTHDRPAAEIIETLRTEVHSFTRGAPADDDRTAIIIRCRQARD